MVISTGLVVSEAMLTALHYIYRYRYLTVAQLATATLIRPKTMSEMLLRMERRKLLGFFGNTGIRGYGKTPKVYYLTKTGHGILSEEAEFVGLDVGPFKAINISNRWSPQMYHRLATLDVMVALERQCNELEEYTLPATFLEYRRDKVAGQWVGETTDFVSEVRKSENRIVPDAGFILENTQSAQRALFLIEVDRGTERLVSQMSEAVPQSFKYKIEQYDRYLTGGKFKKKYEKWGVFSHFVLLVITTGDGRVESMRKSLSKLPDELHQYYRFTTQDAALENFFHGTWRGRSDQDQRTYNLIRRNTT